VNEWWCRCQEVAEEEAEGWQAGGGVEEGRRWRAAVIFRAYDMLACRGVPAFEDSPRRKPRLCALMRVRRAFVTCAPRLDADFALQLL